MKVKQITEEQRRVDLTGLANLSGLWIDELNPETPSILIGLPVLENRPTI